MLGHSHTCGCQEHDSLVLALGREADPTRTLRLRRNYVAGMNIRWDEVIALIAKSVLINDAFGFQNPLIHTKLATAQEALDNIRFGSPGQMAQAFDEWYQEIAESLVMEPSTDAFGMEISTWQDQFIRAGFAAGLGRSIRRLRRAGINVDASVNELLMDRFFRESLRTIQNANFASMQTVIQASGTQIEARIRDTLVEGYAKQETRAKISRTMFEAIKDRVEKVAKTRSEIIARTEIIRAHGTSSLDMYEKFGVTEVRIILGPNPCPICVDLAARTYTIPEARDFSFTLESTRKALSDSPTVDQQIQRISRRASQNPNWGVIPAHPRCVCSWDIPN